MHTFIERVLTDAAGPLGGKLRAGRSRNDQAANDLKLYLRVEARNLAALVLDLQDALLAQAARHVDTLAPGSRICSRRSRSCSRISCWRMRRSSPATSIAASTGTAATRARRWAPRRWPGRRSAVQPEHSAAELGYDGPCENSIDAVGSRDHVAEFVFVAAMIGVQLSRLAEEVVLWCSKQFQWIELDDAFATGSSIMPQKKNPDIAELTRGRAARLIGDLSTMLTLLKALPFSYNRDLSEDKRAAFDAVDSLAVVLPAMTGMVRTMRVNVDRLRRQSTEGLHARHRGRRLAGAARRAVCRGARDHRRAGQGLRGPRHRPRAKPPTTICRRGRSAARPRTSCSKHLTLEAAVAARTGYGGTAPAQVREQIARLRAKLAAQSHGTAD